MINYTALSIRYVILILLFYFFQIVASIGQCNGTEMLMSKMGRLGYNYSDYSWNPNAPTDRNVPCEIKIHSEQATYIDLEIRFVASARLSIYDENNDLVKVIDGYGWNQVPDVNLTISGSEITIVYESLIMSQYELTAFLGSYDSNGLSAGEEILECSGTSILFGSTGTFATDARKIVMQGQGMTTPCEWVIESENASWIKVDFKEFYAAEVEVLDENNNVIYNPRTSGRRRDFYSVTVPGSKVTIRHIESLSNMSFWHGMYTSDGEDRQCTATSEIINLETQDTEDHWNSGGTHATAQNYGQNIIVRNDYGVASSVFTIPLHLSHFDVLEINFNALVRGRYYGRLYFELSTDGGGTFNEIQSYRLGLDIPNDYSLFDLEKSFVYEGQLTDETIIRIRSGMSGSAIFESIQINGFQEINGLNFINQIPDNLVINAPSIDLSNQVGIYSGIGFENNIFTPSAAGLGEHEISYVYNNSGICKTIGTKRVVVHDPNNICSNEYSLSIPAVIYTYQNAIPLVPPIPGGIFSGEAVSNQNYIVPSELEPGTYTISYINVENNCTVVIDDEFTIREASLFVDDSGCTASCNDIYSTSFENNGYWPSGWIDGGSYARMYSGFASTGSYSLYLRGNYSSSMATSPSIDLSSVNEINVSMSIYTRSFESSDGFVIEISPTGNGVFEEIGNYSVNVDFQDYSRKTIIIEHQGEFTTNTKFRIRCNSSNRYDYLYIDDFIVQSCEPLAAPEVDFTLPQTIETSSPIVNIMPSPSGGTLTGPGLSGTTFNPSLAGVGTHSISYTYEEAEGCSATLTKDVVVEQGPEPSVNCLVLSADDGTGQGSIVVELANIPSGTSFRLINTESNIAVEHDNGFTDLYNSSTAFNNLVCGNYKLVVINSTSPIYPVGSTVCESEVIFAIGESYGVNTGSDLVIDLSCLGTDATCSGIEFLSSDLEDSIDQPWSISDNILTISNVNQSGVARLIFIDSDGNIDREIEFDVIIQNPEICDNGIDDDNDGFKDCADSDCNPNAPDGIKEDVNKSDDCLNDEAIAMQYIDFLNDLSKSQTYWDNLSLMRSLYNEYLKFANTCNTGSRKPYREPGLIPYCFWDKGSPDWIALGRREHWALFAGAIDGTYATLTSIDDLLVALWEAGEVGVETGYLLFLYYTVCIEHDDLPQYELTPGVYKTVQENLNLLTNISEENRTLLKTHNSFDEKIHWDANQGLIGGIKKWVVTQFPRPEDCDKAEDLVAALEILIEYLSSEEAIVDGIIQFVV